MAEPLPVPCHSCNFPPIAGPNAGLFLSIAVLSNINKVDLCRVSNRCTGLLIHYLDGSTTTLGQWNGCHVSQHSCIYHSNQSSITNLCFGMAKFQNHSIVTDIRYSIGKNETELDSYNQIFGIGEVMSSATRMHVISNNSYIAYRLVVLRTA
jgi:hypothetical protein